LKRQLRAVPRCAHAAIPRTQLRGLIEAVTTISASGGRCCIPRTQLRGLIEAHLARDVAHNVQEFRGLSSAASLKRVPVRAGDEQVAVFRGLSSAASLKLAAVELAGAIRRH